MIIFPVKIIDCLILGCNSFIMVSGEEFIKFISETNNEKLIKNGKYALFCPECKFIYTKNKIEQFLLFNIKNKDEINNLKKLLGKSNTKEIIISNPELMFCPIVNCEGFAKKNNDEEFNICQWT